MSKKINDGGQAFPGRYLHGGNVVTGTTFETPTPGMTLRDYFAAKVLHAILVNPDIQIDGIRMVRSSDIAKGAYKIADGMIQARKTP